MLSGHPCACPLQIFRQRHYWAADLGDTLCIGMSTVRFRSNAFSVHEVFIDEEQLAWFEATLQRSAGRPVIVFTHVRCPLPMGSVSCGAHFRFTEDQQKCGLLCARCQIMRRAIDRAWLCCRRRRRWDPACKSSRRWVSFT